MASNTLITRSTVPMFFFMSFSFLKSVKSNKHFICISQDIVFLSRTLVTFQSNRQQHKPWPVNQRPCSFWIRSESCFFSLSLTGQACLTHVDTPMRGNNQACTNTHTARINSKINKSFIFTFLLLICGEAKRCNPVSPLTV